MSRLQLALDQIVFARHYTLGLLEETKPEDWFRLTAANVSHVGWQVGHLAFAQYRLALWRIRGPLPEDEALFTPDFIQRFGPKSIPESDASNYPAPNELRAILDRVHTQVLRELPQLPESELDQPVPQPHPFAKTKFLALLWCANHEMLHAGQIGLLRRQLGQAPMW